MGGDLPARTSTSGPPVFVVRAMWDPGSETHPGTPLQRIQIVKLWLDGDGSARERVFHVVGDEQGLASADPQTCEQTGDQTEQLCGVWTDPNFNADAPALYYARVLENPSCRWSTLQCLAIEEGNRPPRCADPNIKKVIQERAWSSPIWYQPPQ